MTDDVLPPWPSGPSSPAYRIAGGRVEVLTLPEHPDVFTVPEPITKEAFGGERVPVCLLPGAENRDYREHALPLVREIATRITPWATWYLAPGYFGCDGFGGAAWRAEEVAICRTALPPPHAVENALHEAWHLAEEHVDPELLDGLDARLARGPAWPGDYYPKPCERRARAFAHFGMFMVEGGRQVVSGKNIPGEVDLFWRVFAGDLGREITAARAEARPSRFRRLLGAVRR